MGHKFVDEIGMDTNDLLLGKSLSIRVTEWVSKVKASIQGDLDAENWDPVFRKLEADRRFLDAVEDVLFLLLYKLKLSKIELKNLKNADKG